MYVIPGYDALGPDSLVSTNLPAQTVEAWVAGTTYLKGQLVTAGGDIYEAAVGPATFLKGQFCGKKHNENLDNKGFNPEDNPTVPAMDRTKYPDYVDIDDCYRESGLMWWIKRDEYWPNKYRMFQESPDLVTVSAPSSGTASFSVTCTHGLAFRAIALVRVQATSVVVTGPGVNDTIDLTVDPELAMPGADIYKTYVYRLSAEIPANTNFTVTFIHDRSKRTAGGQNFNTAECGLLYCGYLINLGLTLYNSAVGIQDFSKKDRDAFGNAVIVPRNYLNKATYKISIDTNKIYYVTRFLASIRSSLSVYVGDPDLPETIIAGFFKDFSIPIESYSDSIFTLEVEGL